MSASLRALGHDDSRIAPMTKLTIRCHPCTPVAPAEIQDWLELKMSQLRAGDPEAIIRLSRVSQELPKMEMEMGWLIELELPEDSALLDRNGRGNPLADTLTDMRFLGLQPLLLFPTSSLGVAEYPESPPLGPPALVDASGPVLDYPGLK
jgi:hypothetical protein